MSNIANDHHGAPAVPLLWFKDVPPVAQENAASSALVVNVLIYKGVPI